MAKGVKMARERYKFDKTAKNFPNLWIPTMAFYSLTSMGVTKGHSLC